MAAKLEAEPHGSSSPAAFLLWLFRIVARTVDRIAALLAYGALLVAVAGLCLMVGYTVASVVGRSTGWFSLLSADEIGGYALATLVFMGMPYSFRTGAFVRVGVFYERFGARGRARMDAVFCAIALAGSVVIAYYFWLLVQQSHRFHLESIGLVAIHLYIPQLALAVGMTIFCVQLLAALLLALAEGKPLSGAHDEVTLAVEEFELPDKSL